MFKKIVLALDGSEQSDRSIGVARDLAQTEHASIEIVHVRELIVGRAGGHTARADEDALEAKVRAQAKDLEDAGYTVHVHVESTVSGGPAHVIASVAERVHSDVIVIGTRGHAPVAGLLLGSVTQRLLHIATCPVLAIPASFQPAAVKDVVGSAKAQA